jgi:acyl-CoA thioesterase
MAVGPNPVETMMAADVASRTLGIELIECGDGHAHTRMVIGDHMVNGHGIAHGGLIFSLADTAFACACNSWGPPTVAAGADIVFVAPARVGDVLDAHAHMRTRYRRHGIYDVTVRGAGGVIAEFRGRSVQLPETQV